MPRCPSLAPPVTPPGLTLVEMVLVLIIVAMGASLATVSLRAGMENRQAKQALETAKSIAHSVRMYQLDTGSLPTQSDLSELIQAGYLKQEEFAFRNKVTYSFSPNTSDPKRWKVTAVRGSRSLQVENRSDSFAVTDSSGLFNR